MYIPTSFFSSQGSCITATASTITGSGTITTGSFISGGFFWDYYQFETTDYTDPTYGSFTASLNVFSGSTNQAKLLIVGAGGAGGSGASPTPENYAAGGGGGGGVVYYDTFPLSTGIYEIAVGGATTPPGTTTTGSNGRNSYVKLPNNVSYTPFTSSFLTAYGGGGGGWGELDSIFPFTCRSFNGAPGPSTGGVGLYSGQCPAGTATSTIYTTLNGIAQGPQGYRGGNIEETEPDFTVVAASGGGGAATTGSNLSKNDMAFGLYASNGGDGLQFNMNGTSTYFSPGGGGQAGGDTGATGLGGNTYGRGGQGERDGSTSAINRGYGGVVIIAIPRCLSAFSCKNFAITGSNTTLSYLNCGFPFVTSSKLSSNQDQFTACLLTYSGSNTPVLLTGATTSSVLNDCSGQLTSSAGCNCTYIRAVPNSGTQIINLFPCNGSGSVTQSVPPAGKFFCIESYSTYSFPSGGVTEYGSCITGSCAGISYTSSFVNCSSYTATAGGSGATFIYLPCGSSSVSIINLSGSESRSVCAAYTSSFGLLTGAGSTYTNFGTCSYQFPNTLIQKCNTSITQSVTFTGSATYIPNVGNIFTSATSGLSGSCWSVVSTTTQSADYTDIIISEQFVDCATCFAVSGSINLEYLVVGGGGGGGYITSGGGGGAGGFVTGSARLLASQSYAVVVGGGGIGSFNGGTSSFWSSSVLGGGRGGNGTSPAESVGGSGSSGGGGFAFIPTGYGGGLGTTGQGFAGGSGSYTTGNNIYAGGGGGAAGAGANGSSTSNGGAGKTWLDGNYYAGGGGGARYIYNASLGLGGIGGGGRGAGGIGGASNTGSAGVPNTGGGGGGDNNGVGPHSGGSGVVKIRYFGSGSQATGGTISYSGSYTYHTFTASGNFII